MRAVTAFEAKTHFGKLLKRVAQGEHVVITKYGKPVARIVPNDQTNLLQVQDVAKGLHALREDILLRTRRQKALSYAELKSAIEDGRR